MNTVKFQHKGDGGGDVHVRPEEVQAVVERFTVGGAYCVLHLRGGGAVSVWGRQNDVMTKLGGKT